MSAGTTVYGIPTRSSSSRRRGDAEARMMFGCITLEESHLTRDRSNQLGWIVSHALFEHHFYLANIRDIRRGVSVDHNKIRLFSTGDGSNPVGPAKVCRTIECTNLDGFLRREAASHQKLNLALVRVTRHDAATTGWILSLIHISEPTRQAE